MPKKSLDDNIEDLTQLPQRGRTKESMSLGIHHVVIDNLQVMMHHIEHLDVLLMEHLLFNLNAQSASKDISLRLTLFQFLVRTHMPGCSAKALDHMVLFLYKLRRTSSRPWAG